MFDNYQPIAGRFDELMDASGHVRAHWRGMAESLGALDDRKLTERRIELQRLLLEHGVTYNIYGRDVRRPSPWALDLLPVVFTSREWREVEVGVAQRAELLRLILADLYGPQKLILRGLVPAELVFRHAGFLLPCWSAETQLENALVIYAADLGRTADGALCVTADRTQAPSGIGYTLEARTITSRVLPSLYRESNVHPVLPFLRALRRTLLWMTGDDADAVGVLTPGAANETYSEHAYLARQMGLPLLEGDDLIVDRGRCWMLTASGRQPIRTLLRRMDDGYCEPLELNRQSVLGTPGVLQAVRNRNLSFANALGAGVLENPGLMAFLPKICKELLGEDLRLPSTETWWCGRSEDLGQVLARFDELVLCPIAATRDTRIVVAGLDADAREQLRKRVLADPGGWAAQRAQRLGSAPVLTRQGVAARSVEMRTFAVSDHDSFRVMSGGLARAGRTAESWRVSGQAGGVCKDIWVLSADAQRDAQILPQYLPRGSRVTALAEPHVADNLLWMARYLVRGELLSRMLGATFKRLIELGPQGLDETGTALCRAITWQTTLYPGFVGPVGSNALEDPGPELLRVLHSVEPSGLQGICNAVQQAAYPVRHLLTNEISALLIRLDDDLHAVDEIEKARRAVFQVELCLAAIIGYLERSLPEGGARQLIELGMAVESAQGTVRLLRSLGVERDTINETGPMVLDFINSTTGFVEGVEPGSQAAVFQVALLAQANPCSVRNLLMRIESGLRAMPTPRDQEQKLETSVANKLVELGVLDLSSMLAAVDGPQRMDQVLEELHDWLRSLADGIEKRYTPRRPAPSSQLVLTA